MIIDTLRISNNAKGMILDTLERYGMFSKWTEPVQWGSIIQDIMNQDEDELISACKFFSDQNAKREKAFGQDTRYMRHMRTSFGREGDR